MGLVSAIITSMTFVDDAKINIATGLKSEINLPTSAPNGIAKRVSTRENPKTLPCISVGTVSCRTDATIVFQAIIQLLQPKQVITYLLRVAFPTHLRSTHTKLHLWLLAILLDLIAL